jgi:hypothetical protein
MQKVITCRHVPKARAVHVPCNHVELRPSAWANGHACLLYEKIPLQANRGGCACHELSGVVGGMWCGNLFCSAPSVKVRGKVNVRWGPSVDCQLPPVPQ